MLMQHVCSTHDERVTRSLNHSIGLTSRMASLHYIVAATPRSGSILLRKLLTGSALAGRPIEHFETLRSTSRPRQPRQYFDPDAAFTERLAPTIPGRAETPAEFAAMPRASREASTTPNGIYGTTVMWGSFDQLAARLATRPGLAHAALPDALEATFPNLHFIQVRRADKVAQGVSLWIALQQDPSLANEQPSGPEPFYDFDAIDHLVRLLTAHEANWSHWLARHDFPVFNVVYEQLLSAPVSRTVEVLRWLDIPGAEEVAISPPRVRKPTDLLESAWTERYTEERTARDARSTRPRWRR
jgi:trehalose 2-sulfotransferase